jgi:hypothetical protein
MNKYVLQPVLFNSFLTGNFLLKKIFALIFFLTLLFAFNTASAQWVSVNSPSSEIFRSLHFVNEETGWASTATGVYKTINGGMSWTSSQLTPSSPFTIGATYFINMNTGFATTEIRIYKTTNGGSNWNEVSTNGLGLGEFVFINSTTGFAIGSNTRVYKTTNTGDNWTNVLIAPVPLNSVYFINANTGWIVGNDGYFAKTTNNGANWVPQDLGSSLDFSSIAFTDINNGRLLANDKFITTTDGGNSWFFTSILPGTLYNQFFINADMGWIAGSNSIFFTSNRGTSWLNQSDGLSFELSSVLPGYMYCGGFGTRRKTTNYGFNLTPPSNLTASPASASQINLSWTASDYADKYLIERSPNGATGWTPLDSVNGDVTTYQNTGLNSDQGYYYRVYDKKLYFTSGYSNVASARTYMNSPALFFPENSAVIPAILPLQWSTVTNGFFYTVQVASDSNFSNLVYSTTITGTSVVPANIQNSTKYYWHTKVSKLDGSNESQYSTHRSFIYQNPNYGHNISSGNDLYYFANSTNGANPSPSKPSYNWRDTSGSVNLILNTVAIVTPSAGNRDDGRFDITGKLPPGRSIRFFGTNYTNFYIGTNGIIAFAPFTPGGEGYLQPSGPMPSSFITNAVFPCWKDLNFADTDVPVNRLCYKVTSDELIITYMRAPNYNAGIDVNDYVSFQIIIKHSSSPVANSKIEIMYNYDQTGSSFITKYNNNTLAPNLIGIQGNNSSSQFFQYRYLNSTPQLISPGPMFSSPLALAFGPDENTLPVELASFTSTVNANNVELNWSTASEENNSGFEVERCELSVVNRAWKKVGFVQGNGTTMETKNYSYEDRNVQSGNYKYRLKQIDYNGNFEYHELSGEVIVGVPTKHALSQNYPNPFNPVTKINFEIPNNSKVVLQVFDVTGKLVSELMNKELQAGYYKVDFNGANFASGIYFYRLVANDFIQTKKMLLVK